MRALQQKKARGEEACFLVEGIHLAQEVLKAGWSVDTALIAASVWEDREVSEVLASLNNSGTLVLQVTDEVFSSISDTPSPQGVLLAVEMPLQRDFTCHDMSCGLWLILDGLQDPGNVGALIRSADAAGAAGVVLTFGCADPYGPKALRAAMGSTFHLPVFSAGTDGLVAQCRRQGVRLVVAAGDGQQLYCEYDWTRPVALVLGNEGQGVGEAFKTAADSSVRIPLVGRAESLNVAAAGAVLLYEAARQRGF